MYCGRDHKKQFLRYWICFVIIFSVHVACKKDNTKTVYPVGTNENINTWILDSLKRYYYWSESLTSEPGIDKNPKDFFAAIRNPADRFSYIVLPDDASTKIPGNRDFGFDYTTVKYQNTNEVIGIIKLVLSDSPAFRAGLKRGDYISKINNKKLTENAEALQQEIFNNNHFLLGLAEFEGNTWVDTRSVEIIKGVTLDQSAISKIIESEGKKVGYLYFQDFNAGLASSLNNVFAGFKSAGITELILDLRYNSGGQVAEAAGLCAMIAAGVTYDKPFIIYKGNRNGGVRTESIGSAATFDGTVNFNALTQNNLGLNRVYVLCTGVTASASEVMINNLRPYMQVIAVGEKTRGKDEASFRIFDARIPKQVLWEMHPIVYKLFNSDGNGDYSAGINPDLQANELTVLPLLSFGETADPLVKMAMAHASGKTTISAKGLKSTKIDELFSVEVLTDSRLKTAERSMVITHR